MKHRTIALKPQTLSVAAGTLGVVKIITTSRQRTLIAKARKAKLSLAYSLKYADGTVRTAKKSYLIKIR